MSDPIPREGETEGIGRGSPAEDTTEKLSSHRLPPEDLPEELLRKRLARLDTRRALADLCKSIPGLDEILLPRGIQADALTRKAGSSAAILKGVSRRILQDAAAWGALRTAIQEQIPPETFEALKELSDDNVRELAAVHTTEGLLFAVLSSDEEPAAGVVESLTAAWREDNQKAEKKASESARVESLEAELDRVKKENERLFFTSRTANERAATLGQEVDRLASEREEVSSRSRRAEETAATAWEAESGLKRRISELERRSAHLERSLSSERSAYSKAAERVEEMHEELGLVVAERDRIQDALENARFTDKGFGELLVRAVKNEVGSLPNTLDSTERTAQLLDFMSKVLAAHAELREPRSAGNQHSETRTQGNRRGGTGEEAEDPDPSPAPSSRVGEGNGRGAGPVAEAAVPKARPMLSFRALGGAGEVGGSSHLLDFGRSRVLVDAGIKPDGRGPLAPDFESLEKLDAAVVTHAHLDHCGALPLLCRDQPDLPIYCTPPSAKLIIAALNDHAAMGGGLPGGVPINEVRKRLVSMPFGKPFKAGDARITFTESGHILGAASVLLEAGSATTFHTGDICLEDHFSIPSARLPEVKDIDLLIMEATLADQRPQPFSESIRKMVEVINETTVEREGSVLIPTYALGQAQEIILGLKHYGQEYGLDRDVFIYVDGSVVTTSERLYAEQLGYMKPYLQHSDPRELFFSDNIRAVSNDDAARERILSNPCAIIASPVTMQGGASAFYRRRLHGGERNAVILPSNAAQAANGGSDEEKWRVEKVSFAAHCTQKDLMSITEKLTPRQIILVHGSKRRISDLAYLLSPSHKIHTPTVGETVRTVL